MTITNMGTHLLLESPYITLLGQTPADYEKVDITGCINCCPTSTLITTEFPYTATPKITFGATSITIWPAFFGLTEFTDGIYKFEVKIYEIGQGTTLESNCIFIDITFKCKVAALLKNIITENKTKSGEKLSTTAHILHYALFNGSNCGCNCEEMCQVFTYLNDLLSNLDPQIFVDCGC